jgi:copper chaperone CopZ
MCCQGCVQKVAAQLYALPGVTSVQGDVAKRLVAVTAKPSQKLTLERIWLAVEKAKCSPSKLVSSTTTYTLTRAEKLDPTARLATGQYLLEVAVLKDNHAASAIADQLNRIQGVERVGVDLEARTLAIDSSGGAIISPWVLIGATERAQQLPVTVRGPFGSLSIERTTVAKTASAAPLSSLSH